VKQMMEDSLKHQQYLEYQRNWRKNNKDYFNEYRNKYKDVINKKRQELRTNRQKYFYKLKQKVTCNLCEVTIPFSRKEKHCKTSCHLTKYILKKVAQLADEDLKKDERIVLYKKLKRTSKYLGKKMGMYK
jgi:hypothetical protein